MTGQAYFGFWVNSRRDHALELLGIFMYFSVLKEISTCLFCFFFSSCFYFLLGCLTNIFNIYFVICNNLIWL